MKPHKSSSNGAVICPFLVTIDSSCAFFKLMFDLVHTLTLTSVKRYLLFCKGISAFELSTSAYANYVQP